MNALAVIGWVAVASIIAAAFIYVMLRVERRAQIRRAERRERMGLWGAGGAIGGGTYGAAGDANCGGGGCGGAGCGGGGGGCGGGGGA